MIILGVNAHHPDASACLIKNGKIIIAIEEERLNRIKHFNGFPHLSIKHCLKYSNINKDDINFIAINKNPYSNLYEKIRYNLNNFNLVYLKNRIKSNLIVGNIQTEFNNIGINKKIFYSEHHLSHIYNAVLSSPFQSANIISVDGSGDFVTTILAIYLNKEINIIKKIFYPNSLGFFYSAITKLVGFKNFGDEYKLMGLSAHGNKNTNLDITFSKIINISNNADFFKLNLHYFKSINNLPSLQTNNYSSEEFLNANAYKIFKISNNKIDKHKKNIAYAAQNIFEKTMMKFTDFLYSKNQSKKIILTGGCAQNSLFNGRLTNYGYDVFVPPAPHDAGGSIGAAMHLHHRLSKKMIKNYRDNFYSKRKYTNKEILSVLNKNNIKYSFQEFSKLTDTVAKLLSKNKIFGWFQDESEFGPRALGHRSIIADPRNIEIKNIINKKIKKRELFRPFAPSILEEYVSDWFVIKTKSEYMNKVIKFKSDKINLVKAVKNIDNTGRLHTVNKKNNYKFYTLIYKFYKITKVPILLNTSFNQQEPIVETPQDALNCFFSCNLDYLVINNFLIKNHFK
jgi:carbamoyltransferase